MQRPSALLASSTTAQGAAARVALSTFSTVMGWELPATPAPTAPTAFQHPESAPTASKENRPPPKPAPPAPLTPFPPAISPARPAHPLVHLALHRMEPALPALVDLNYPQGAVTLAKVGSFPQEGHLPASPAPTAQPAVQPQASAQPAILALS